MSPRHAWPKRTGCCPGLQLVLYNLNRTCKLRSSSACVLGVRSFALACITCQRDSGCCARIVDYEPIHQAVQASSLENCAG